MAFDLNDPTAVLLATVDRLVAAGIEAATYGGLALAAYGAPRETKDADLAIAGDNVPRAIAAMTIDEIVVVTAFTKVRFGGLEVSRMSLVGGGKLNMVDLITPRSIRFAGAVMERAITASVRGHAIKFVSAEDFILLKILSTRGHDIDDARSVMAELSGRLDLVMLEREAAAIAVEITDHDVLGRYRAVVA